MAISASKLTTLAQLKLQSERIVAELTKYAKKTDLGSLASKNSVSYDELAAALKQLIDGKQDSSQVSTAITQAIADSGHAHFEKVDTVPEAAAAQENVMYLILNDETGHYDIYALVGEEVVQLDDTTVDLSGYATTKALNDAIAGFIKLTALSTETTGDGNAITGVSYDSASGKFTFTKGSIFLTAADVPVASDLDVSAMLTEVFGAP